MKTAQLDNNLVLLPDNTINSNNTNVVFNTFINSRFNASHSNKTGISFTNMVYNYKIEKAIPAGTALQFTATEKGNSTLISAYTQSVFSITPKLTVNSGITAQQFTLNSKYSIEPRASLQQKIDNAQTVSFAYGLHSRLERLQYYFIRNAVYGNEAINKNMDFTKAHHWVLGYSNKLTEQLFFKAELYYQHLFDVPVIKDSSFSFINLQSDWFFNERLQNTGKGKNYGIDLSLDKFMSQGFYYMLTASVFNSKYTGGDGVWRNTRHNRNLALNFLTGKEWYFGRQQQKLLGLNIRFSYQGGDRYADINHAVSAVAQDVVFNEQAAFANRLKPSFVTHFTFVYRVNKQKTNKEFAIKILNATGYKEFYGFRYNYKSQQVQQQRETIVIPNISYKIEF